MTEHQASSEPRRCPRCGGLMVKPLGSNLYWHADNNHPRCDITNLVDSAMIIEAAEEPPDLPAGESPKEEKKRKK